MSFIYNKKDAKCMWCKRTKNPHKDFNETIPTKIFISQKKREIELCFFCYENELDFCNNNNISFKKSMFAIAVAELSESSPRPQYRRQVHINSVTRYVFGIAKIGNWK